MKVKYKLAAQNPYFLDTLQVLTDIPEQIDLMWQLESRIFELQNATVQYAQTLIYENRPIEDAQMRYDFYRDLLPLIESHYDGADLKHCCWCYRKEYLLDREKGLGRQLHSKQGIQRSYSQGIDLYITKFGTLTAFPDIPKFSDDTITNKQLVSEDQLQQLLALEEKYGKLLAPTCKKKDVLNVLNLERLGLLNKDFTPTYEQQQEWTDVSIQRQREEALNL